MTMTLYLGWWIVPVVINAMAFLFVFAMDKNSGADQYGAGAIISLIFYMAALLLSLLPFLVWALIA